MRVSWVDETGVTEGVMRVSWVDETDVTEGVMRVSWVDETGVTEEAVVEVEPGTPGRDRSLRLG